MKPIKHPTWAIVLFAAFSFGFLLPAEAAAKTCDQWVAQAVSVRGIVEARKAGETHWVQVKLNDTFCAGDMIRVQENSRAAVALSNETTLSLDQKTTITFAGIEHKKTFLLDLLSGAAHFFSRFPRSIKVLTPFVNASVEGTEFYVKVEADQTFVSIFDGRVAASNEVGSLALTGGQSATARAGQAPRPVVVVNPRDAVQWALYYPPIINWRQKNFPGGSETDWQAMVRRSIGFYWESDMTRAFSALEKAPEDIRDPRFYLYRAALFLSVGRVDAAQADITRVLNLDPANSSAFALQSIMAVVQNKKEQALKSANKAVELDSKSSAARVALSYAQQSHFDIHGALRSLQEAVKLDPESALARARLAELYLSVGDLDKALDSAKEAVALNPNLARTQTVLGFAYITQIKIKDAKNAFLKAIELDSAAPLPRLGLGLAIIRDGDLEAGRAEIEIASGLDPNNSLIRSYLGKAYFDEKQDKLARDQFAIAKQLDPKDPTPWFYDAIRQQTINRPVEALHSMQKAIELNDNRGVFRSRLLLDQDLAARSAALGRIYNNLGFQQLGLLKGWKSLNSDPSNYSAHRLLADSYSALPQPEIARVSELLQSQLLQPLNVTPVQPQLSQTNLLILDGAGPSQASFNEFNPLFLRNRLALIASGVVGNHDTKGDELTQSGVWGRYSYSLGQFKYKTDGFRNNNDLDQDIYDAFAQVSVSPKVSVQAEYRHRDIDHGDLTFLYDLDDFNETFDRDVRRDTFRAGFHYAPATHSDLIASVIYQDARDKESFLTQLGIPFEILTKPRLNTDGYIAEGQYIFRQPRFNFIAGGGHYDADNSLKIETSNIFFSTESDIDFDTDHSNGYFYSHLRYPSRLTWTIGASYDSFDDDLIGDTQRFSPKLGATLDITADTTVRLAFFKVLKRTLFADQTLEPTQVAGFNQFFDDVNGTKSTRFGGGVDHAFSKNVYGGLEYSARRLRVPISSGSSVLKEDWDEDLVRAYLYWTVYRDLAVSMEYQFEDFDRDVKSAALATPSSMHTHMLPVTLRYFHPTGLFGGLKTTYVHQKVKSTTVDNEDNGFALVDLAVGYRLPKRYGILSFEVGNLFDKNFDFQGLETRTSEETASDPLFYPERTVILRLTLAF
jgi:tetratricopeptide (TPR) repeat protein